VLQHTCQSLSIALFGRPYFIACPPARFLWLGVTVAVQPRSLAYDPTISIGFDVDLRQADVGTVCVSSAVVFCIENSTMVAVVYEP